VVTIPFAVSIAIAIPIAIIAMALPLGPLLCRLLAAFLRLGAVRTGAAPIA
jgi:hypothetical protein